MTEEKATERCEDIIKKNNKVVKEARKAGDTNAMQLVAELDTESLAMQTVLNMLKEKDKEINRKSSTIKALQCALYERTEERDRKDYIIARQKKQIDLMAEKLEGVPINKNIPNFEKPNLKECITIFTNKEEVKQHFKSKAEKEQI